MLLPALIAGLALPVAPALAGEDDDDRNAAPLELGVDETVALDQAPVGDLPVAERVVVRRIDAGELGTR